ncbi:MAG: hypothetical protein ACI7YS_16225, partial [Flavobacterium sp.]
KKYKKKKNEKKKYNHFKRVRGLLKKQYVKLRNKYILFKKKNDFKQEKKSHYYVDSNMLILRSITNVALQRRFLTQWMHLFLAYL